MIITRDTYETFFIDYLEGNLNDDDLLVLIGFLDENPDLQRELADMTTYSKQIKHELSTQTFNPSVLKKNSVISGAESNFEELCIAFFEHQLSEKEELLFLEMVFSKPSLNKTFVIYSKVYNKADLLIIYPYKSNLKKRSTIGFYRYTSYVASIVLLLSFVFLINNNQQQNDEGLYSFIEKQEIDKEERQGVLTVHKERSLVINTDEGKKTPNIITYPNENEIKEDDFNWEEVQVYDVDVSNKLTPNNEGQELISRKGKLTFDVITTLEMLLGSNSFIDEYDFNNDYIDDQIRENHYPVVFCKTFEEYNMALELTKNQIPDCTKKYMLGSVQY